MIVAGVPGNLLVRGKLGPSRGEGGKFQQFQSSPEPHFSSEFELEIVLHLFVYQNVHVVFKCSGGKVNHRPLSMD